MGETLQREFSLGNIDTTNPQQPPQQVASPVPEMAALGVTTMQPSAPPTPSSRPTFLSAFLQNLGPALGSGLANRRGDFGTALGGALEGIEGNRQRRFAEQQRAQLQQAQIASENSNIAYHTPSVQITGPNDEQLTVAPKDVVPALAAGWRYKGQVDVAQTRADSFAKWNEIRQQHFERMDDARDTANDIRQQVTDVASLRAQESAAQGRARLGIAAQREARQSDAQKSLDTYRQQLISQRSDLAKQKQQDQDNTRSAWYDSQIAQIDGRLQEASHWYDSITGGSGKKQGLEQQKQGLQDIRNRIGAGRQPAPAPATPGSGPVNLNVQPQSSPAPSAAPAAASGVTVPMIDANGREWSVPQNKVGDAIKRGAHVK